MSTNPARDPRPETANHRELPSVDQTLQNVNHLGLPRPLVVHQVRNELTALRKTDKTFSHREIFDRIQVRLHRCRHSRLQSVINATGILVHTNLGRSPISSHALDAMTNIGGGYSNLEFDLHNGRRGGRAVYLEQILALLCRAEAATVVNNGAAALVLILRHLCSGNRNEVVISRGELLQIGGGFRIPEILEASGAQLREVGTTNQTNPGDYAHAIGPNTALVLKVHRSNFFMEGFVDAPTREELAALARSKRVPLVEDLGSGAVVDTDQLAPLEHEPTPTEALRHGVHLVCFSGDKLLGGPQAGIIAGKKRLVSGVKKDPFYRAARCDKLILSALQSTVEEYLATPSGVAPDIPVMQMLHQPGDELEARAKTLSCAIRQLPLEVSLKPGKAKIGGGSLPRSQIPSTVIALRPFGLPAPSFSRLLRDGIPPIVGYLSGGWLHLDLRTVDPKQDAMIIERVRTILA